MALEDEYSAILREREELSQRIHALRSNDESIVSNKDRIERLDAERWEMHRKLERLGTEMGWEDAKERVLRDVIANHYSFGEKSVVPGTFVISLDRGVSRRLRLNEAPGNLAGSFVEEPWYDVGEDDLVFVYDTAQSVGGDMVRHEIKKCSVMHLEKMRRMESLVKALAQRDPPIDARLLEWTNRRDGVSHAYDNLMLFGVRVPSVQFPGFMTELRSHLGEFWFEGETGPFLETVSVSDRRVRLGKDNWEAAFAPSELQDESEAVSKALEAIVRRNECAEGRGLWNDVLKESETEWASDSILRRTTTVSGSGAPRVTKSWEIPARYSNGGSTRTLSDEQLVETTGRLFGLLKEEERRERDDLTERRDTPQARSRDRR